MGRAYWKYYRTRDGKADYRFSWEEQPDGTWRIYIENQPSYGNRPSDNASTHRHSDGERKFVCWTKPINSIQDAMEISAVWADKTQNYIRTGESF
jgi:hypothetical protein